MALLLWDGKVWNKLSEVEGSTVLEIHPKRTMIHDSAKNICYDLTEPSELCSIARRADTIEIQFKELTHKWKVTKGQSTLFLLSEWTVLPVPQKEEKKTGLEEWFWVHGQWHDLQSLEKGQVKKWTSLTLPTLQVRKVDRGSYYYESKSAFGHMSYSSPHYWVFQKDNVQWYPYV